EETSTSSGWAPKPRPRPSPRRCGGSGRSCGAGAEDHDEPNHEVSEVDADLLGRRWTPCSGARRSSPGAVPEAPPGVSGLALQALIRITSFAEFAAEAEHRHKAMLCYIDVRYADILGRAPRNGATFCVASRWLEFEV
ncbi:unnamed protein product, partial [Prorocentrum cordatum]